MMPNPKPACICRLWIKCTLKHSFTQRNAWSSIPAMTNNRNPVKATCWTGAWRKLTLLVRRNTYFNRELRFSSYPQQPAGSSQSDIKLTARTVSDHSQVWSHRILLLIRFDDACSTSKWRTSVHVTTCYKVPQAQYHTEHIPTKSATQNSHKLNSLKVSIHGFSYDTCMEFATQHA